MKPKYPLFSLLILIKSNKTALFKYQIPYALIFFAALLSSLNNLCLAAIVDMDCIPWSERTTLTEIDVTKKKNKEKSLVVQFCQRPKGSPADPTFAFSMKEAGKDLNYVADTASSTSHDYEMPPTPISCIYVPPTLLLRGSELNLTSEDAINLFSPVLFYSRVALWEDLERDDATTGGSLSIDAPFILRWTLPRIGNSVIVIDASNHMKGEVVFSFFDNTGKPIRKIKYPKWEDRDSIPVFFKQADRSKPFY